MHIFHYKFQLPIKIYILNKIKNIKTVFSVKLNTFFFALSIKRLSHLLSFIYCNLRRESKTIKIIKILNFTFKFLKIIKLI